MISSQKQRQNNKVHNGNLRTPVKFYKADVDDSLHGREKPAKLLFSSLGEVYNPSMKDLEIMRSHGIKQGLTIRIRDPFESYQPDNKHFLKVDDERFKDVTWNIKDIRPDFYNRDFIIILVSGDHT